MKTILSASDGVLKILAKFRKPAESCRMLRYVVEEKVAEGVLLYNFLTKELLFLTHSEWENRMNLPYLRENWFFVPENTNEKELVELVRWILTTRKKKPKHITGYTIFTTTDCNARCFYCFELGRSRIPMTAETARKVAAYMIEKSGGETVKISWFGGEPLFNPGVIDIICDALRKNGTEFRCNMISNGYLFDAETAKRAAESWNVKKVQITLDGTENIYNKTKAYIYKNTNPYQTVLANIGHLLDSGITVTVRLNMDLYNAGDLLNLVDELAEKFPGRPNLRVYAHHLFDGNIPMAHSHSQEEWEKRDEAMAKLNEKIHKNGFSGKSGLSRTFRLNHCMADSGQSVTILPDGNIGLCEHFSETEFIGHIAGGEFDQNVIKSWQRTTPEIPECATCFAYPDCTHLKKCPNGSLCFPQERSDKLRKARRSMQNEYRRFLANQQEEAEEEDFC